MNKLLQTVRSAAARIRDRRRARPLYGRSATDMIGLYLLSMVGVAFGIFVLFMAGYSFYHALGNHIQSYWIDFATPVVIVLYEIMCRVRDMALLLVILLAAAGWLGVTWGFFRLYQRDLTRVVEAAGTLMDPAAPPPNLPNALSAASARLERARGKAQAAAAAAREAEQRKNDLVVYLAHDLKTPLTSVIGYLTLLQDEPQISTELRARYTGIALHKAERLEDLINEFFDITRFSLTHLELERRPLDLTRMLAQIASEFEPVLREKELTCALDLPPRLTVDADPDKLARVFDNLLRNAGHYSFPGSTVRIAGRQDGDAVTLTFENEGRTIPPEKLDRLFEQFFRLDSSRGTGSGGAGLGLAIARQIVEAHGGAITAASARNTVTFTVTLPAGSR